MVAKNPKTKSVSNKRRNTPPIEFKLSYETAANIHDILTQQSVHVETIGKSAALKDQFDQIKSFYNYLTLYLEKYS